MFLMVFQNMAKIPGVTVPLDYHDDQQHAVPAAAAAKPTSPAVKDTKPASNTTFQMEDDE